MSKIQGKNVPFTVIYDTLPLEITRFPWVHVHVSLNPMKMNISLAIAMFKMCDFMFSILHNSAGTAPCTEVTKVEVRGEPKI